MEAKERKDEIQAVLRESDVPVSATALAKQFGVSRQVIVGDIALMRASGADISSTARGYLLHSEDRETNPFGYVGIIACRHGNEQLLTELYCVVDNGGCVIDVLIEHPIYGQLCGNLDIHSRFDADEFASKVHEGRGTPLSALTGGIHLHRVGCRDEVTFRRVENALNEKGILLRES